MPDATPAPRRRSKVADLNARLAAVEEALRAFRRGELEQEKRQSEDTLRDPERRFRALIESSFDGIVLVDPRDTIEYCSPTIIRMFGYAENELIGRGWIRFVDPDDLPVVEVFRTALIASPSTAVTSVFRIARADGSWRSVDVVGTNLLADPTLQAIVYNIRDVTERVESDILLRRRARQQEAVASFGQFALEARSVEMVRAEAIDVTIRTLGASAAALAELLPDGRQLHLTAGRAEAWHVPLGLVIEVDQQSQMGYTLLVRGSVRSDDIQNDTRFRRLNVDPAPNFLSSASVLVPGDPDPFGVLIVHSMKRYSFSNDDIHFLQAIAHTLSTAVARLRFEAAIHASEERYRRIVDTTTEGIGMIDANNRITYVNQQLANLLGYSVADMIGVSIEQFMTDSSNDPIPWNLQSQGQGVSGQREYRLRHRDSTERYAWLNLNPLFADDGHYEGTLAMVTDITAQRNLEAQLRQAQKLEAIGQLAGGVAHDFNNLLTVINGYAELVSDTTLSDAQRDAITQIRHAGDSAASLTQQLLAFSRQQVIVPRNLDLNETVGHLGNILRRLIGEDIVYSTQLAPSLGVIRVDPGQIEQILLNLAANARDAMPRGGRLTITTSNVEADPAYARRHAGAEPGSWVVLSVSDTGTGMEPEVRERIFDPFFTTKELAKGTGLGLAAVHGIVKQNGGSIGVDSKVGAGTVFTLYFPRIKILATSDTPTIVAMKSTTGSETVLVAEDDPGLRALIRLTLERSGYTILAAPDGAAALALAEQHPGTIDLLVTDVVMPNLGGRLLAESLVTRFPALKIIYISGYTDDMVVRHGVVNATVEFLQKPFTLLGLSEKVRQVLDLG